MSVRGGGTGISYPVSISDVQTVLGNNSSELKDLCTATNINKWARFKPERIDGPLPVGHGTSLQDSRTRKANNFSLTVPYCNATLSGWRSNVMNKIVADIILEGQDPIKYYGWEYLKPRGNRSQYTPPSMEFFRLSDFAALTSDVIPPHDYTPAQYDSLKGYNHNAEIPFIGYFNAPIYDDDGGSGVGRNIIVNKHTTPYLTVAFENSRGTDLHLEDFVNVSSGTVADNVYAWRPVLQVFKDSNSGDSDYPAKWYQRDQPYIEVSGDAITDATNINFSVSLDVSDSTKFPMVSGGDLSDWFYLCIGVGYCKKNTSLYDTIDWGETSDALFIIPYEEEDVTEGITPFYFPFKVANYNSRSLLFTTLVWYRGNGTIEMKEEGSGSFQVWRDAQEAIYLTFTMSKDLNQAVDILDINTMNADSNSYAPMKLKVVEQINGSTANSYFLEPKNPGTGKNYSDRTLTATSHYHVDTGQTTERTTLYTLINTSTSLGNLDPGSTINYRVFGLAGTAGQAWSDGGLGPTDPGSNWVKMGEFSIYKKSTYQ